ncbi:pilus assembly protein PilM [Microgenomates group bacterium]|nr:pilus assembly protein PilM [Microgenomates group bacterium]
MPVSFNKQEFSAWDIGASSIKIVWAANSGQELKINKSLEVTNSLGFTAPEEGIQVEQMQALIGSIIKEYKLPTKGIRLSLPESAVSTQIIELPNLSDAEIASSISWQAAQYLPIPNEELVTEYSILYRPPELISGAQDPNAKMRLLLIGTRKKTIANFVSFFRENGAEPAVMETQTVSLLRHFNLPDESPRTMIVNFGDSLMNVVAVNQGELVFSLSYPEAGALLTKTLISEFNLSSEQALSYKVGAGLDPNQAEGKIRTTLMPIMDMVLSNLRNADSFFASKTNTSGAERLILTGGSSALIGLIDLLAQSLKKEVVVADNFTGLTGDIPATNQLAYSIVLGLIKRRS